MPGQKRLRASAEFSEAEAEYLAERFIGHLATTSARGEPHVVPVSFRFDGSTITFGGSNIERSLKFRNMMANNRVAFVVDDLESVDPWRARGVEMRGRAEPVAGPGGVTMIRITPLNISSWGLKS